MSHALCRLMKAFPCPNLEKQTVQPIFVGEHESISTRLKGSDMTEHFDSNVPLEVSSPLQWMIFEVKKGFHNQSFIGFINHTPHSDSWVCL